MISKSISNVLSLAKSITSSSLNAFLAELSTSPWEEESGDFPIGSVPNSPGLASVLFEARVPSFVFVMLFKLSLQLLFECSLFCPSSFAVVVCPLYGLLSLMVP